MRSAGSTLREKFSYTLGEVTRWRAKFRPRASDMCVLILRMPQVLQVDLVYRPQHDFTSSSTAGAETGVSSGQLAASLPEIRYYWQTNSTTCRSTWNWFAIACDSQDGAVDFHDNAAGFLCNSDCLAEREGFEPPIPVKVCPLSRRIVSTTHAPLRVKSGQWLVV